jgi:hypothetical protein
LVGHFVCHCQYMSDASEYLLVYQDDWCRTEEIHSSEGSQSQEGAMISPDGLLILLSIANESIKRANGRTSYAQ